MAAIPARLHGKCMLGCGRYASVVWIGSVRTSLGETGMYGCRGCVDALEALVEEEIKAADQAALVSR
jgi:hypothetical protein